MTNARSALLPRPVVLLLGLLIVVGLPVAGKWLREDREDRCSLDGLPVQMPYRHRIVDEQGVSRWFCCVGCARAWLARQDEGNHTVYLTDETSGMEIAASAAHFVLSAVVTNPVNSDRIHVFRDRTEAEAHARAFGGRLLTGQERPFPVDPGPERAALECQDRGERP